MATVQNFDKSDLFTKESVLKFLTKYNNTIDKP
jgi:hypothetical protein